MFMLYYFAPIANTLLVFEAVSLCPYVAIMFDVDVNVLLGLDSKHLSSMRGRVPFDQQSMRLYVCHSNGN